MDRLRAASDRLELLASDGSGSGLLSRELAAVAAHWRAETERDIALLQGSLAAIRARHEDARDRALRQGMSAEGMRQAGIVCALAAAIAEAGSDAR